MGGRGGDHAPRIGRRRVRRKRPSSLRDAVAPEGCDPDLMRPGVGFRRRPRVPRRNARLPRRRESGRSQGRERIAPTMVAGVTGLEPAASGVTGRRSNQTELHPPLTGNRTCTVPRSGVSSGRPGSGSRTVRRAAARRDEPERRPVDARDREAWWAVTGSNRRPPRCKRGALPAELTARSPARRTKRRRPPAEAVGAGRRFRKPSVHGVLQNLARLEPGLPRGRYVDALSGSRIAAFGSAAFDDAERAEADESDVRAVRKRL